MCLGKKSVNTVKDDLLFLALEQEENSLVCSFCHTVFLTLASVTWLGGVLPLPPDAFVKTKSPNQMWAKEIQFNFSFPLL